MTTAEPTATRKTALADEIARQLNERAAVPRATIARAVATLGEERARTLLAETQRTEANGGLLLPDGSTPPPQRSEEPSSPIRAADWASAPNPPAAPPRCPHSTGHSSRH